MKKLISKSILVLMLCSVVALSISFNSKTESKEVMVIKTFVSFETEQTGLAVFHGNKSTEFIGGDLKSDYSSEDDFFKAIADKDGKMLLGVLQKYYDQGWELVGVAGGEYPTYILSR